MKKSILITDLDNTLYDWFQIWYRPFLAMLTGIEAKSGIARDILIADFKKVFSTHGTTEYAFAIQELPALLEKYPDQDLVQLFDDAIHAFRSERKKAIKLYEGVFPTLNRLHGEGVLIIGYTESLAYYTHQRMRKLDLDLVVDKIYSPPDHDLPINTSTQQLRKLPADNYELRQTEICHTPRGEKKPNPRILLEIISDVAGEPDDVVYVGDNLMKDIRMAQDAGVTDAWAQYGQALNVEGYELLRQVTHWSPQEVNTEKALRVEDVRPTYSLMAFDELLKHFKFVPFREGLYEQEKP